MAHVPLPPASDSDRSDSVRSDGARSDVALTARGVARGAKMGLPFCASSVVYGVAFGLLAAGIGLSSVEAVAMSALVFSGSAQVAVIQAWHSNPSFLAVFVTVFIANVRYVLMSATLRDWLAPLGGLRASAALLPMVDGTFALSYVSRARGDYDAGILLGSSLISYSGWIAGTAVGTVAGQLITNPRAIGLDFIIVSFCVASATLMYRGRADILPGLAAIAAVVGCEMLAPGPWTVVAAGVAAALTGALLGPDGNRQSPSAKLDERQA